MIAPLYMPPVPIGPLVTFVCPSRLTALSFTAVLSLTAPAWAQVTPDTTLGDEMSTVTSDTEVQGAPADLIEGGAQRGSNLFHSFLEFNVNEGQRVYFANPAGIESILSRITGGAPSNILGTLGVDGPADLFLLNPNGIVFGENVALDVNGSFYATTAEAIPLGNEVFSATQPEQSTLLTVAPGVVFTEYLTDTSGDITHQGVLFPGNGESLTLAANQLDIQGDILTGNDLTLVGIEGVAIANSTIGSGNSNGDLLIQGSHIDIVDSFITMQGQGELGDIILIADNTIAMRATESNRMTLLNFANSEGAAGNIFIAATDLTIANNNSQTKPGSVTIRSSSFDGSDAGEITIDVVNTVLLEGSEILTEPAGEENDSIIGSILLAAENLEITAELFRMGGFAPVDNGINNLSRLIVTGDLRLTANQLDIQGDIDGLSSDNLLIQGQDISIVDSGIVTGSGDITLLADNTLEIAAENDFTGLSAFTVAGNPAGDVFLKATDLIIIDRGNNQSARAVVSSSGDENADNGIVTVEADDILLRGDVAIIATSLTDAPEANAIPDIRITANNLELLDGAFIAVGDPVSIDGTEVPATAGRGGDIAIELLGTLSMSGFTLVDTNSDGVFDISPSFISTTTDGNASGNIRIVAEGLKLQDEANIRTSTLGIGNAGSITLDITETVSLDNSSDITTSATDGDSGDLQVTANTVEILGGSRLSSSLVGEGNAGDITIMAAAVLVEGSTSTLDAAEVPYSRILSSVQPMASGDGGNITITADNLSVTNGGFLDTSVLSGASGTAGDIVFNITETARFEGAAPDGFASGTSSILSSNAEGRSGSLAINAGNLEVLEGARLTTATSGNGDAGDITLNITEAACIEGTNPISPEFIGGVFSSVNESGNGSSGDIRITANTFDLADEAGILASNRAIDPGANASAGDIAIDLAGELTVINSDVQTVSRTTSGGRVDIQAESIVLSGDSDIRTDVDSGEGQGGDITLTADTILAFDDSDILAFSADGQGGDVTLNTLVFLGENFQPSTQLTTPEELEALDGNNRVDVNATGSIESGNINLPDVSFIEGSLNELSVDLVDTETLTAGSCIIRSEDTQGSFVITGGEGLPQQPEGETTAMYATGAVRPIPNTPSTQTFQEPEGVFELADGRLVLSQKCPEAEAGGFLGGFQLPTGN